MQLTYNGPFTEVEVPDLGLVVERGETVDIDPDHVFVVADLCAGDWTAADDEARDYLTDIAAAEDADEEPATEEAETGAPVPPPPLRIEYPLDGTIADILDWVDADEDQKAERAATAAAYERAREKPRTTLLETLEQLAPVADTEEPA